MKVVLGRRVASILSSDRELPLGIREGSTRLPSDGLLATYLTNLTRLLHHFDFHKVVLEQRLIFPIR